MPNMTVAAANGLPTLRATPLCKTPISGIPALARMVHAAKNGVRAHMLRPFSLDVRHRRRGGRKDNGKAANSQGWAAGRQTGHDRGVDDDYRRTGRGLSSTLTDVRNRCVLVPR
jgi:hypothetical protein